MSAAALLLANYVPFLHMLPGSWAYWYLLLLPLCVGVSVVYKAIRCHSMREVPREAAVTTMWILLAILSAGAALVVIVKVAGMPSD